MASAVDSFVWRHDLSAFNLLQYAAFVIVVAALVKPLGGYMARVFSREKTFLDPVLRPVERLMYRLTGVDTELEMNWAQYSIAFLVFGLVGALALYAILRLQQFLLSSMPAIKLCP
jgi:K+-transporting ATPase ATPase A chain